MTLRFRKGPPFEFLDTLPNGDKRRRYLLQVRNDSLQELTRCSVQLTELRDDEDIGNYAFIPVVLKTEHQADEKFHLSAGESKMVMVVSLIESQPNQQLEIHFYSPDGKPNALPADRKYSVTIGVFGAGVSVHRRFVFSVENGRLKFAVSQKQLRAFGWNVLIGKCS